LLRRCFTLHIYLRFAKSAEKLCRSRKKLQFLKPLIIKKPLGPDSTAWWLA